MYTNGMRNLTLVALLLVCSCGAESFDYEVEPVDSPTDVEECAPAPSNYTAWLGPDGNLHVSRRTGPSGTPGAIIQHLEPTGAPILADFGDQQVIVNPDATLCAAD